jgi:hypothetical protein
LSDEEVDYIKEKHKEYDVVYNNIELIEFNHINGALVINVENFINEICHALMVNNKYKIVFLVNAKNGHVNVRHNVSTLNIGDVLSRLNLGGGQRFAAGMNRIEPADMLIKKLLTLEKYLYVHFPELQRSENDNS